MVRSVAGGGHLLGVNGTQYDWKGTREWCAVWLEGDTG